MQILKRILTKLSSRKFLVTVGGFASGVLLILNGETTEGTSLICAAVLGYLAAEGLIDLKAIKQESDTNDSE